MESGDVGLCAGGGGDAGLVGRHVGIGVILQEHGVVVVVELAQVAPEAEPPAPSSLVGVESRRCGEMGIRRRLEVGEELGNEKMNGRRNEEGNGCGDGRAGI